jgi:hypothetical protein
MKRVICNDDEDSPTMYEGEVEGGKKSLVKTAIRLKEAIDSVATTFSPIGDVVNAVKQWKLKNGDSDDSDSGDDEKNNEENDNDEEKDDDNAEENDNEGNDEENDNEGNDEEDDNEEIQNVDKTKLQIVSEPLLLQPQIDGTQKEISIEKWLHKMRNVNDRKFDPFHYGKAPKDNCFTTRLVINVGEFHYDGTFMDFSAKDESNLENLVKSANVAAFGDQRHLTTVIDENVRKGHDIDDINFQVSDEIVKFVENTWGTKFYPQKVKAVPYKINLYKKGDKFISHKDTPAKNLIGTFLLGMSHKHKGTSFKVETRPNFSWNKYEYWSGSNVGDWAAFLADVPHEVNHENDNVRATMSFKIYSANEDNDIDEESKSFVDQNISLHQLPKFGSNSIGIILSHDYSLNTTCLKGVDRLWYYLAKRLALRVEMLPVIVQTQMMWYRDNYPAEGSSSVYALTDDHIRYLTDGGPKPEQTNDNVEFYMVGYDGYEWQSNVEPYVEYTGNESQPMSEDSLYLHKAIILHFQ